MTTPARAVQLRHHADLVPAASDDTLVTASVGPGGEAIALWSTAEAERVLRARTANSGFATFPKPRPPCPVPARVTVHRPGSAVDVIEIAELDVGHPMVQPLPDGRVLVVGSRCQWRPEGPDRNAVVYGDDGTCVARGTLGDGIGHLLTTPSGAIWVGYFDEGIYGNLGWGYGDAPAPIGSPGIVRFGADLEPDWRFPVGGAIPAPDDVYAMNVDDETVWSCYYNQFPIVRIDGEQITEWSNQARGNYVMLVADDVCALIGGHYDAPEAVAGRLHAGAFSGGRTSQITMPAEVENARARLISRGAELHVIAEQGWFKVGLEDFL